MQQVNRSTIDGLEKNLAPTTYLQYRADIEALAMDKEWCNRVRLSALLSSFQNKHAEKMLLFLLHDKNYLVQVEAIDSLSSFPSKRVKREVWACTGASHPLVRGYAYRCMCVICSSNEREKLKKKMHIIIEKNTWARIMLNISLLQLGDTEKMYQLLNTYRRCNYLNRIAILNGFSDSYKCLEPIERKRLIEFFDSNKPIDEETAVEEAFIRLKTIMNGT